MLANELGEKIRWPDHFAGFVHERMPRIASGQRAGPVFIEERIVEFDAAPNAAVERGFNHQ